MSCMSSKKSTFSFLILAMAFSSCGKSFAQTSLKAFEKTVDGVLIYPDSNVSGNTGAIRLQVISDKIIRVTAYPGKKVTERKSLITVDRTLSTNWTVNKLGDKVVVKTPLISATVVPATGAVSFADKNGVPIVRERQHNGRTFQPAVFTGESSYGITQTFETSADDAYYGLGQHQDDQFNYKGKQVFMFQNNTEVAVPF